MPEVQPPSVPAAPKAMARRDDESPFSVLVGQVYEGPLDLLLDLIRKQDIDIYDIPIAKITAQYLKYVEGMKQLDVDVAADFIYTASLLIHIKSKMLLPRDPDAPAGMEDPRTELVNRLLEHERFKTAAQMLLQKQQIEEAVWSNPALKEFREAEGTEPELAADVVDLVKTFQKILDRARKSPDLRRRGRKRHRVADDRLRAPAAGVGRPAGPAEAVAAQPELAGCAGVRVSCDPGADPVTGGAGATGQCFRRDHAQEAHQLRQPDGRELAGATTTGDRAGDGAECAWVVRPERGATARVKKRKSRGLQLVRASAGTVSDTLRDGN